MARGINIKFGAQPYTLQASTGRVWMAQAPTIFTGPALATGYDFYIATNGSDSNSGLTAAAPWAITSLISTSSNNSKIAGKKVGILPGTYNVAAITGARPTDYQSPTLHLPPGNATQNTILQSTTPRAAILSYVGSSAVNSVVGQNALGNGYWTFDGLVIQGSNYSGSLVSYFPAGTAGPVVIQNCEIYGVTGATFGNNYAGIFFQGVKGALIQNNWIHDCRDPTNPNPPHGHGFEEYSALNTQFFFNTISNCDGGIDGKLNANSCTIAGNYFTNNTYLAINGYDGGGNTINASNTFHHNIFENSGSNLAADAGTRTQPIIWYNNTTFSPTTASITSTDLRYSGTVTCYNNITLLTANASGPYTGTMAFNTGWSIVDYNSYQLANNVQGWGTNGGGATYNTFAAWKASPGLPDVHSLNVNPLFTRSVPTTGGGVNQYVLTGSSPCLGAGRVGGTSSGQAVNMGAWDGIITQIGCSFAN